MREIDGQPAIRPAVVDPIFASAAVDVVRLLVDGENEGVVELAAHDLVVADPETNEGVRFELGAGDGVVACRAKIACHDTSPVDPTGRDHRVPLRRGWEIADP